MNQLFINCCVREHVYLFDGSIQGKFVGLFFCLTKHDGSAVAATVNLDYIAYHSCAL